MPRNPTYEGNDLTVHHPAARRYLGPPISNNGYTAMDLWKFYGLVAGLWCAVAMVLVRYGDLFADLPNKTAAERAGIITVTLPPLLFTLPVICIFLWWLAGAMLRYSKWQMAQGAIWQPFWLAMLAFYAWVLFDPLNNIHTVMARKGLAPAPNLIEMLGTGHLWPLPLFQFQWGYSLLWWLLWFLVIVLHWRYLTDGLAEVWFYANRFRRYGNSVLTGFSETARLAGTMPVTRDYPRVRPVLPQSYRGVPRLNVDGLTVAEAQSILAEDASGAITSAPGQPTVLFVDLGAYDFSPGLAELQRADGTPLLSFSGAWPKPEVRREKLVIPLVGTGLASSAQASEDDPLVAGASPGLSGGGDNLRADAMNGDPTGEGHD